MESVGWPAWITRDLWDLSAKLPPNMALDQEHLNHRTELMLQWFLADRFKLKVHRKTRDEPIYELMVAKGGSRLKVSENAQFSVQTRPGRREYHHQSMEGLALFLYSPYAKGTRQPADRPVLDRTGLPGFFDFTLEWTPDTPLPDSASTGPSIFTALEELGLKLQPKKSAVELLIIDSAERPARD